VRDHFAQRDLDHAYVERKFGVAPERFVDYLAMTGDSTNGIPGVPGIGPKTAAKLLAEYGSLGEILTAGESIEGKLGERLQDNLDEALLAESLVRLRTDHELGLNLHDLRLDR
jgi:5'-3' exonuclease